MKKTRLRTRLENARTPLDTVLAIIDEVCARRNVSDTAKRTWVAEVRAMSPAELDAYASSAFNWTLAGLKDVIDNPHWRPGQNTGG